VSFEIFTDLKKRMAKEMDYISFSLQTYIDFCQEDQSHKGASMNSELVVKSVFSVSRNIKFAALSQETKRARRLLILM